MDLEYHVADIIDEVFNLMIWQNLSSIFKHIIY